jgi:mannose/fructose/N-acetylgalactosamine-specific phosphotransferase system component IID
MTKNALFAAIASLIAYVVTKYMPTPPGTSSYVQFIAISSTLAGASLSHYMSKNNSKLQAILIIPVLLVLVISFYIYILISRSEPSPHAELWLFFCTAIIFMPFGYLIETAGIKYS